MQRKARVLKEWGPETGFGILQSRGEDTLATVKMRDLSITPGPVVKAETGTSSPLLLAKLFRFTKMLKLQRVA